MGWEFQIEHTYPCNALPGDQARIRLHSDGEVGVYVVEKKIGAAEAILSPANARDMALRVFVHTINPNATDAEREVILTKLRLLIQ